MGYWLAQYIGSGTDVDPFRPSGVDGAGAWFSLDMRGDETAASGHAFVWVEHDPPPGLARVSLGNDPDAPLNPGTVAQLRGRLGVPTLRGATVRTVVRELLTEHGTPPGDKRRWNPLPPLTPGMSARMWRLGPMVDMVP